jgi:hypothetical protein
LVSPGLTRYFERRYPHRRFSYLTNGIDSDFLVAASETSTRRPERSKPLTITYAGNLGTSEAPNWVVFRPWEVDHALEVFGVLEFPTSARSEFVAKCSRFGLSRALAEDLLSIAGRSS